MQYKTIPVTSFSQNCSILWCEQTRHAAIIDPGGNIERIIAEVDKLDINVTQVLLTHGHIDHVGGATAIAQHYQVPINGPHKDDQFLLDQVDVDAKNYGFPACKAFVPDRYLVDDDVITVGDEQLQVIHCPGHTPGHVIFYSKTINTAWVGDVLFKGSIGRTDFPRGNHQNLIDSITQKLWPLGNDVQFVSGHGPKSTFGMERENNPFVADKLLR